MHRVHERLGTMDGRLDGTESTNERMNVAINAVNERLGAIEGRLAALEGKGRPS